MRKIVLSVLSVAGLLAALLALTSGSVSAETGLITVEGTDVRGGTYTVSWKAKGGCSSSSDGSVSKAVEAGASGGDLTIGAFNTNNNCQYDFTATYVTDAAAGFNFPGSNAVAKDTRCAATVTPSGVDGDPATTASAVVDTSDTDCVNAPKITFTVTGPADDADTTRDESADRAAIAARKWVVTATPTGKGVDGETSSVAAECAEASGTTTVTGGVQTVDLTLIQAGLLKEGTATSCQYSVGVTVQDGFEENTRDSSVNKEYNPADGATSFLLRVAQREVFVLQSVTGDSGGGSVEYSTQLTCVAPDADVFTLPPAIDATATPGGIVTVKGKTLVPLNAGRYDVSAGVAGSMNSAMTGTSTRKAVISRAVANDGDACSLAITAKDFPSSCTVADASQTVNLASAKAQSTVEFSFRCTVAAPTTTAAPAPTTTAAPVTATTVAPGDPSTPPAPPATPGDGMLSPDDVTGGETPATTPAATPTTAPMSEGPAAEAVAG